MDAIIHVESRGNANARNGQYVGVLQMSPTVVKAVNQILKQKGLKRRFSLADRYSVSKSREMFEIFMSYYNPNNSIEKRHKNVERRNGYSIRATQKYFRKVMQHIDFDWLYIMILDEERACQQWRALSSYIFM